MSYPENHIRLSWGGSLYEIEDSWQNNLHIINPLPLGTELNLSNDQFIKITAPLITWLQSRGSGGHLQVKTNYIQLSLLDKEGNMLDGLILTSGKGFFHADIPHSYKPAQIALVLSLRSDSRSKLARKGRIYLPIPNMEVHRNGKIDAQVARAFASQFSIMLLAMNTALGEIWPNAYIGLASPVRDGDFGRIIGVSCGDLLDTMQSRKKKFEEIYTKSYNPEDDEWEAGELGEQEGSFWDYIDDILSDILDYLADKDIRIGKKGAIKFKR